MTNDSLDELGATIYTLRNENERLKARIAELEDIIVQRQDATIERCAQVAESFGNLSDNLYANKMVEDMAAAIRALKDKP